MRVFSNKARRSYSTATLLLFAVNVPLAILVGAMALMDYRLEMNRATGEREDSLNEQAALVGNALLSFGESPDSAVSERFIARSCEEAGRLARVQHWINVAWHDRALHYHAGSNSTTVSRLESRPQATIADESANNVVVGRFASGPLTVEVVEFAVDVRSSSRKEVIVSLLSLLVLATIAAILANFALVSLIAKPTKTLSDAVARICENRTAVPNIGYLSRELNHLGKSIAEMSESLASAERKRDLDMKRAEKIQRFLLPQSPRVPGLAISTHFQPAEDVAGDIYGIVSMPDDSCLIYIADLVGHGVPAAMNASVLKRLFDTSAVRGGDPGEVLQRINELLPGYLMENEFATAAVLRWEPTSGRLQFASAGHEPVLLLSKGGIEPLDSTGIPLGIVPASNWKTAERWLQPGDRILMVTDGIAESHDGNDHQFGRGRVSDMFANSHDASLEEFVQRLVEQVNQHGGSTPQEDDVTVLSFECQAIGIQNDGFCHPHHLTILREAVT